MDAVIFIIVGLVLYAFGDKLGSGNQEQVAVLNEAVEDNERQTAMNDSYYRDEEAFMRVANNLRKMLQ